MANPVRACVACTQRDDHPKDQVVFPDGSSTFYHHDCHAMMDPPCQSCEWLAQHKGNLRGNDWRGHVVSLHAAMEPGQNLLHPWERDMVESHLDGSKVN